MKIAIALLFLAAAATAEARLYRCQDANGRVTYSNVPSASCVPMLDVGDLTDKGLVIETKESIAKVQTPKGERWFPIAELKLKSK